MSKSRVCCSPPWSFRRCSSPPRFRPRPWSSAPSSPENFYPGINTTGIMFDANSHIYSRLIDFERGTTKVIPGLAEKWDISADGTVYTFHHCART